MTPHKRRKLNVNKPFVSPLKSSRQQNLPRKGEIPYIPSIHAHTRRHYPSEPHHNEQQLQKKITSLTLSVRRAREVNNILTEAQRLLSQPTGDLERATEKWRTIAHEAAETLFEPAKERYLCGNVTSLPEGQEFTMATMLHSLNIEPKVLGFDKAEDG
ncbi:hypothetical protein K470DRAFT_101396 [Piedraia hortae CBS 480.64]|uniref:Uncharacterized protein n=1 Tax=Piedraia hortae CBS 480.64 TaxID=1314780 RepID=A0A6A7BVY6_9PEZI|nr:hypothetical protein K470DRAFT_101396 [Piedraia hortae CBS 480.64]